MAFEIPQDLNAKLMGVAWLLGTWRGNGHGAWPKGDESGEFEFGQQIDFATVGDQPYLHYLCQTYALDEAGQPAKSLTIESGFWRPHDDATVEMVLTHPEGYAEVWVGNVQGAKIEMTTDLVARTTTAAEPITGGQRLYGNVEGDLLWTWDRASEDVPLQPYMWARLQRA